MRAARLAGLLAPALLGGLACTGCKRADAAMPERAATVIPADGTAEMAALLAERAARVNPAKLPLLVNDRRAALFGEQLGWPQPVARRLQLRQAYARELLNAGQIQQSLEAIEQLETDNRVNFGGDWRTLAAALTLKAMAYLRLGEEQNCHLGNTRDSCLMPIRGTGVHTRQEGSTKATKVLGEILDRSPDDLIARWLLNVAHMTLGSYPDGVPARDLIPPSAFESEYPLPRFDNVAKEAGVDIFGLAGGAVLDDFDNDGRLDLMVSAMGFEDQLHFFHNDGNGRFEDRTAQSGMIGEVGGLNLIQADYDNDGLVDLLVLRGGWMESEGRFPLSLLRNTGNGRFADVTKAVGLLHFAPTQTAVWLDYDGDGRLDLFVGNESSPAGGAPTPCELFHSNPDGTFTNVAREAGVDVVGFVKGVVSADYNHDGRPDLYVSVLGGDNLLLRNDGATPGGGWHFTNVAREAGVTEPKASFGALFFDYDNDGWPDLFVVGYGPIGAGEVAADFLGLPTTAERGRLFHNRGDGTFEDVTKAAGLYKVIPAMGLNFGDLDNDGFLDIYLGTGNPNLTTLVPNRMFRNAGGKSFQDVTTAGNFGHLQKGHGVCFGDIDDDGDQDVFEEMGGAYLADKAYSALYENPGNANHWLELGLEGVRSNRSAIGARIKVAIETPSGSRVLYRTVGSGGSFGASPLRQEIGLGDALRIDSVEVFWPATGQTQLLPGLSLDHRYHVREGAAATSVDRASFKLGGSAPHAELGLEAGRRGAMTSPPTHERATQR